ncbi:MAG: hypothetical protein HY289_04975 [Planctomycetes bacterium]|nr:hypothetical protein [Planctomycetota bacterium]
MKLRSLIREVCRLGHAEWAFDRAEHLMNKPLPMCFERALTVLEEAGIEVDQLLE